MMWLELGAEALEESSSRKASSFFLLHFFYSSMAGLIKPGYTLNQLLNGVLTN
jgi:hypothetical protein